MFYLRSFNRFVLFSLALLGLSVSSVNASLMSADDSVFGAGSVTRDDVSGLEWLDLSQTPGLNYTTVSAELGVGGVYEGWRYASVAEVEGFWINAGIPYTGPNIYSTTAILTLQGLWGLTWIENTSVNTAYYSYAMTANQPATGAAQVSQLVCFSASGSIYSCGALSVSSPLSYATVASALVRPSVVPLPAAVWLFGTALIGLVGFSKSKSREAA
jgi:hypothetical protein